MEPVSSTLFFETPFGEVKLMAHDEGGWLFEFVSGYNNGLHCDVPFKSFEACFKHIKSRFKEWAAERAEELKY